MLGLSASNRGFFGFLLVESILDVYALDWFDNIQVQWINHLRDYGALRRIITARSAGWPRKTEGLHDVDVTHYSDGLVRRSRPVDKNIGPHWDPDMAHLSEVIAWLDFFPTNCIQTERNGYYQVLPGHMGVELETDDSSAYSGTKGHINRHVSRSF